MIKGRTAALRVVAQYASLRYRQSRSNRAGCANISSSATPSWKSMQFIHDQGPSLTRFAMVRYEIVNFHHYRKKK